jgi:hypothetical protein
LTDEGLIAALARKSMKRHQGVFQPLLFIAFVFPIAVVLSLFEFCVETES